MEYLFLGLFIGLLVAYLVFSKYGTFSSLKKSKSQASILIENIKSVSKLITVEAEFAEIYHYKPGKQKWLEKIIGTKKAILLIDAKVHVGFDLNKIKIVADPKKRIITVTRFPQAEILSIETDFKYYDKKEGWFNPLTSEDLTQINQEAKQFIKDKIPQSGLLEEASSRALETLQLTQKMAQVINWEVDYSALLLHNNVVKKLPND